MLNSFLQAAGGAEWSSGRGGWWEQLVTWDLLSWAGGQEQAGVGVWGDDGVVRYVHGATGRGRSTGTPAGLFRRSKMWRYRQNLFQCFQVSSTPLPKGQGIQICSVHVNHYLLLNCSLSQRKMSTLLIAKYYVPLDLHKTAHCISLYKINVNNVQFLYHWNLLRLMEKILCCSET